MADLDTKADDFYRIIADTSHEVECWYNLGDELIYISPSCLRVTGYTPQEFYQNQNLLFEICYPEDVERLRSCTIDHEQPPEKEFQFRLIRKDGGLCWINHFCRVIHDDKGRRLGRRSTSRDITIQKQLEAELKELAAFPQQNPDAVIRTSTDGIILYINPASKRWYEALNLRPAQPMPEPFNSALLKAIAGNQPVQEFIPVGDKLFWVTFIAVENGVNIYARNVTELQKTQERFRLLSETAGRLLKSSDPQSLVEELCTDVMRHLECDCFFNYLADEKQGKLHLNACAGIPQEKAREAEWLNYGTAICGCAAMQSSRIVAEDIQHSSDARAGLVRSYGLQAYACHPLLGPGGTLVGTLSFGTRNRTQFNASDLSMMKAVADLTATAMFRMKIEQSLRDNQQDLNHAQKVAHIGSWRLCLTENTIRWSEETYRIFEIPVGTPVTIDTFTAAVHPEDRDQFTQFMRTATKAGTYDCEYRIIADGRIKWVHGRAELQFDAGGSLISALGTVQDITQRRQDEEALLRTQQSLNDNNQLLNSVLDNTHVLVACMDHQFNFIRVNEAYARADDRTPDFFPGKNHFDLYPDPENEIIFRRVVETGEPYVVYARPFAYAGNPERGESYWDWSLVPIRDKSGQISQLVLTLADVTAQKKEHDTHERILNRQRILVKSSEEILKAECVDSLLKTISETAASLTRANVAVAESLYGKNVFCSVTRAAGAPVMADGALARAKDRVYRYLCSKGPILRAAQEELPRYPELNLRASDGLKGVLAVGLFNRGGQVNGLILATDRQRDTFTEENEAEIKQLAAIGSLALQHLEARNQIMFERDQLENRIRQRTEDLENTVRTLGEEVLQRMTAETELQTTNTELQRRAEILSQMASELTVAEQRERFRLAQVLHDHLQQLLVAAKLELSTVTRSIPHNDARKTLEHVMNLLKESIHESRSLTVELYPPILHESGLLGGLEWLVRWMQEKHGFRVELDAHTDVKLHREDLCILLFQSIRELLFNCVKHSGVARARLELRQKGDFVQVSIRDEGKGFDPDQLGARPNSKRGGFGLFSIRERLTSMGGKLEINSAPQSGSTFLLSVPADVSLKPAEPTASKRRIEDVCILPTGRRAEMVRILLVDDHTIMRRGLATLLRQESDMKVIGEAADGHEAVRLARQLKPDIILMDFSLPGINGAEATQIICSEMPAIRVIGLSMFDEEDRAATMFEAGASAYASKSESPVILLSAIRSIAAGLRSTAAIQKDDVQKTQTSQDGAGAASPE